MPDPGELADFWERRGLRRTGHVVLGSLHLAEATSFLFDGLGFRVSDQILNGVVTFGRIETDHHHHHNLLLQPASTSYLNHYALQVDDVDAIGKAGTAVVDERPDASVVGVGRHNLGSNIFWFLTDPAGTFFEFFSDMDQIVDDEVWERDHLRRDWEGSDGPAGFSVRGPKEPPPDGRDPAARVAALDAMFDLMPRADDLTRTEPVSP